MLYLIRSLLIILFTTISFISFAQEISPSICGTAIPDSEWEIWFSKQVEEYRKIKVNQRTLTEYNIPVIIHILHDSNDIVGQNSNIDTSQVYSQIARLNNDFSATNADYNNTPQEFQEYRSGDTGIRFCLAKVDTNGTSLVEKGINRVSWDWNTPGWGNPCNNPGGNQDSVEQFINYLNMIVKPATIWNPEDYLNIWIYDCPVTFGFAYFPLGTASWGGAVEEITPHHAKTGVAIYRKVFGINPANIPNYNAGRSLTHEIGHWLGLRHISGDAQCTSLQSLLWNDHCDDTPRQFGGFLNPNPDNGLNHGCPTFPHMQDICIPPNENGEMFMNYMDYTYDECKYMFTEDQADRMRTAMLEGTYRNKFNNSTACQEACPDLIILGQSSSTFQCNAGDSIHLFFKEKNIGGLSSGPNYVSFHLSSNEILTPGQNGDTYIGEYFVDQNIEPQNETPLLSKQVQIPASITPGTYYLFFSADGSQIINECNNEHNNFATVLISISDSISSTEAGYRYWFNNQFSQAVTAQHSFGNHYVIEDSIATTSLSEGLHTLHMTFKDTADKWSSTISSLFLKIISPYPTESAKYDYWFDNNFNSRIVKSINNTSNLLIVRDLNMGGLNPGLHSLNMRFKPDGKHWSSTISSLFYKINAPFPAGNSQYEYWFDTNYDTRIINSIPLTSDLLILDSLSTAGMSDGLHTFHIRSKPDSKHWSTTISNLFYKNNTIDGDITKYQYWFDSNFQDTVTIHVPPTENLQLTSQIDSMNIPNGLHSFHIRYMESNGMWSSITSDLFYKSDAKILNNKITKFVYWYDNDWQNSQSINLPGLPNDSFTIYINAEDLPEGPHTVNMFFKEQGPKWSSVVSEDFTRTTMPHSCPYTTKLLSSGIPTGQLFQWQVNTGNGFVDVINNSIYSGANTDTLILTNAPTSWYGNMYRCMITIQDEVITGEAYTLRFALYWEGSESKAWENPQNWSCNTTPDAYTDVYISSGVPNFPEVNSNTSCRHLKLSPSATITMKAGNMLTITGNNQ